MNSLVRCVVLTANWETLVTSLFWSPIAKSKADEITMGDSISLFVETAEEILIIIRIAISMDIYYIACTGFKF